MSGYFSSNHTTSRFLANNAHSTQSSTNSPSTPSGASAHTNNTSSTTAAAVARSRLPASKHFSTSVNTATLERTHSKDLQSPGAISALAPSATATTATTTTTTTTTPVHPLRNTWVFYYRQQRSPGNKIVNYEEGIKKISAFSSVESFWSLWTHLAPPSDLQPTTDYLLFHSGVRRPVWEDPINITGGKWIIRLRKGVANRLWEDLVLAIIGDQFDECKAAPQYLTAMRTRSASISSSGNNHNGNGSVGEGHGNSGGSGAGSGSAGEEEGSGTEWPEICGCTISVRQNEDIISLWNRCEADYKVREKIRDALKKALNLPASTVMEYKTNNDSMQDRSSFRTTTTHDRTPH